MKLLLSYLQEDNLLNYKVSFDSQGGETITYPCQMYMLTAAFGMRKECAKNSTYHYLVRSILKTY